MKKRHSILFISFLVCFLSGLSGCSNTNYRTKSEGVRGEFEIAGDKFVYVADTTVFGNLPSASFVVVCKVPSFASVRYEYQTGAVSIFDANRLIVRLELRCSDSVVSLLFGEGNRRRKMLPNMVLFVDANEIVLSKSFQELGISETREDGLSHEKLQPILEKLILENVQPKDEKE